MLKKNLQTSIFVGIDKRYVQSLQNRYFRQKTCLPGTPSAGIGRHFFTAGPFSRQFGAKRDPHEFMLALMKRQRQVFI